LSRKCNRTQTLSERFSVCVCARARTRGVRRARGRQEQGSHTQSQTRTYAEAINGAGTPWKFEGCFRIGACVLSWPPYQYLPPSCSQGVSREAGCWGEVQTTRVHRHRQTETDTARQTDTQTDGRIDRQIDRQTKTHAHVDEHDAHTYARGHARTHTRAPSRSLALSLSLSLSPSLPPSLSGLTLSLSAHSLSDLIALVADAASGRAGATSAARTPQESLPQRGIVGVGEVGGEIGGVVG